MIEKHFNTPFRVSGKVSYIYCYSFNSSLAQARIPSTTVTILPLPRRHITSSIALLCQGYFYENTYIRSFCFHSIYQIQSETKHTLWMRLRACACIQCSMVQRLMCYIFLQYMQPWMNVLCSHSLLIITTTDWNADNTTCRIHNIPRFPPTVTCLVAHSLAHPLANSLTLPHETINA